MEKDKRALRRHHRDRLKDNRRSYHCDAYRKDGKHLSKLIDTPTPCSCHMCGNPRRHHGGPTLKERSHGLADQD